MPLPAFKDVTEAVRASGDIVRLVSEYVPLKPGGSRLKGLCPFHQEKTPSFSVDQKLQLFYCFGCQAGGDIFKFVMLYEKVGFREAVELLADRWGVKLQVGSGAREGIGHRLVEMNQAAATFFARMLSDRETGRTGRDYLERRGVGPAIVSRLGLGYSPDLWDGVRKHLHSLRFTPEEMLAGGLVVARKEGCGEYDRFRDRLMFPIRDASGRTLAFGGRALGEAAEPKYLNSPETPVYVKGHHLYGLHLAREAIRREGRAIVVEGYLDLAALLEAGFDHAVASLGTAFTPEQARLLARYTNRVIVSYDGDAAGGSATARTLDLLLEKGFEVRVVELPAGLDPDDLIRREGAEAYGQRLRGAPSYLDFLLHRETLSRDLSLVAEKVAAVNAILPHLARLGSPIERASWAGRLAEVFAIEDALILQELRSALRSARGLVRQRPQSPSSVREVEARLVALLLDPDVLGDELTHALEPSDLEGTRVFRIVETILRVRHEGAGVDYATVFGALEGEEDRSLLTRIAFHQDGDGQKAAWTDCLEVLKRERLVRQRSELQRQIESTVDPAMIDALLLRKQLIGKQIDSLS